MVDYIIPFAALLVSVSSLLFVSKVSFASADRSEVALLRGELTDARNEIKELRGLYEKCLDNEARLQRENTNLLRQVLGLPPEERKP